MKKIDKKQEVVNPIPKTAKARDISEIGKIVYDVFDEGLRFIIMRGPFHWCGYVGIPKDHPMAGLDYDDISFISAHGGLTFSSGARDGWPEGYYWYGWDYGHSGDYCHYLLKIPELKDRGDKDWTIEEVIEDSRETLYDFKKLMSLVEKITKK